VTFLVQSVGIRHKHDFASQSGPCPVPDLLHRIQSAGDACVHGMKMYKWYVVRIGVSCNMDRSLARGTAKPVSSRRTSSPGREAPVSISVNPKIASRTGLVSARRVLSTVKRVRGWGREGV
jgi:hypothetical protein